MKPRPLYATRFGKAYVGECDKLLSSGVRSLTHGKVQMLFTSPPFVLNRKKRYGNLQGEAYVEWLKGFAVLFGELLTPSGSIVIELGNGSSFSNPILV
jgi:site-specific DNA-methyltransferase (cytosine-N4-specific)